MEVGRDLYLCHVGFSGLLAEYAKGNTKKKRKKKRQSKAEGPMKFDLFPTGTNTRSDSYFFP